MEKKEFLKYCSEIFKSRNFLSKGQSFYFHGSQEILVVFGITKSSYGPYFYIEYGFAIRSVNKCLPHPKFNEVDLNCGRIMTPKGKAIRYEELSHDDCQALRTVLNHYIDETIAAVSNGTDYFLNSYVLTYPSPVSYVTKEMPAYFGVDNNTFISRNIKVVSY